MSWIPLSSGVIKSSLWSEEDWVIKIFLTMLADKGPGDIYTNTAYALAHDARKTEAQVLEALKILSGPDRLRREKQIAGGARIRKVEGGWLIINAAEYRKRMSEELKRYRNAKAQKVWRQKQAEARGGNGGGGPMIGENAALNHGVDVYAAIEKEPGVPLEDREGEKPKRKGRVGKDGAKGGGMDHHGGGRVSESGLGLLVDPEGKLGDNGGGVEAGDVEGGLADSGVTDDDAPPAEDADRPPEETPIDCL